MLCAIGRGHSIFFVPAANQYELAYISGITVYGIEHFREMADILFGRCEPVPVPHRQVEDLHADEDHTYDFSAIK